MIIGVLLWIKALNQAEINKLTITEKIIMTKSQFYYLKSVDEVTGEETWSVDSSDKVCVKGEKETIIQSTKIESYPSDLDPCFKIRTFIHYISWESQECLDEMPEDYCKIRFYAWPGSLFHGGLGSKVQLKIVAEKFEDLGGCTEVIVDEQGYGRLIDKCPPKSNRTANSINTTELTICPWDDAWPDEALDRDDPTEEELYDKLLGIWKAMVKKDGTPIGKLLDGIKLLKQPSGPLSEALKKGSCEVWEG